MKYFLFLMLLSTSLYAGMPIDTLISFTPGNGQDYGRGEDVFPANIFGLPSTNARENVPEASETQVVSLGLKGEIIVGIKDYYIVDGEGKDFTIFENPFYNNVTKLIFAEPAVVSVSEDGINFVEFPYDSVSLEGLAGKTPTHGDQDPFDAEVSGGDSYDLADIGLKQISYIKIRDVAHYASLDSESEYYSPLVLLSGFDLDAVVGINVMHKGDAVAEITENLSITKNADYLLIETPLAFEYKMYNLSGEVIAEGNGSYIQTEEFYRGVYILQVFAEGKVYTEKFII